MELKWWCWRLLMLGVEGSNRTFMELKFTDAPTPDLELCVLIVPLWN